MAEYKPRKDNSVTITALNKSLTKYLLFLLESLTQKDIKNLNSKDRYFFKTGGFKKIINTDNLEFKIELLAKLGINFSMLFYLPYKKSVKARQIICSSDEMTEDEMIEKKIWVVCSSQLLLDSMMLTQKKVGGPKYMLNRKFEKVTLIRTMLNESKSKKPGLYKTASIMAEGGHFISDVILQSALHTKTICKEHGITETMYLLLLYLYKDSMKNGITYVEHLKATVELGSIEKMLSISHAKRVVMLAKKKGLVMLNENKTGIALTPKGVYIISSTVNQFLELINLTR